ncbi:hypothetical protein [Desulforhopalus singaporensis]|uniref:Phage replisome organizer, putative, N-terminal region n=1 Tax=Desulforhopalus singaporensis TaxID=91360 RepID=A0A1H0W5G3_9BACT|nr:hypothetical protein [Desulforhopalus singaporensis]SDP85828.1 hypothetical protein SAMN05660330_04421 [Desulforhopalus singaporensis]SDP85914.1 hypothetical protein SAMN05660330_04425 [Desulforhopalus singaporensis]
MNTDIRIAVSFRGNRKRKKLALLLGPGATDYLLDLWIGVAMSNPTGMLVAWDEHDIALEAGWQKDSKEFVDALMKVGFLEINDDGVYQLHDWEDHQGYVIHAQDRRERAKKAAAARWEKKKNDKKQEDNAKGKQDACVEQCKEHADSNAPTPTPTPIPTPIVTDYCPEPSEEVAEPEATDEPVESPVLVFPLIPRDGDFPVLQKDIDEWQETFPGIDVLQVLKRARQWSIDNPKRRKTKAGIRNHISTWLSKEQNKARAAPGSVPHGKVNCEICQYNQRAPCKNLNKEGFDKERCDSYKPIAN